MADNDPNLDTDWPLLRDAIRLVLEVTGSTRNTKELLFDYLARGRIRWRCWRTNFTGVGSVEDARLLFWRLYGSHIAEGREHFRNASFRIDIENSVAAREGTAFGSRIDKYGDTYPVFVPGKMSSIRFALVRLYRPDLVTMLRETGFALPAPATEPPVSTEPPTSTEPPPVQKKRVPKDWLPDARKRFSQQAGEKPTDYARRLRVVMENEAKSLTGLWTVETIYNRITEEDKAAAEEAKAAERGKEAGAQAIQQKAHRKPTKPH